MKYEIRQKLKELFLGYYYLLIPKILCVIISWLYYWIIKACFNVHYALNFTIYNKEIVGLFYKISGNLKFYDTLHNKINMQFSFGKIIYQIIFFLHKIAIIFITIL